MPKVTTYFEVLLCFLTAATSAAQAESLVRSAIPRTEGNTSRAECQAALAFATSAFHSINPTLYFPIPSPPDDASVVLSRSHRDISGGDGIQADQNVFKELRSVVPPFQRHFVYWQREAKSGSRIVVVESPFSWRGSWYYLLIVKDDLPEESFLQEFIDAERANFPQSGERSSALLFVLDDNRWNPPTILRSKGSGELWVIDQGRFRSDWAQLGWPVYQKAADRLLEICRVTFLAGDATGLEIMPRAVRRFANLADEALGPGNDKGTLQPTARIRSIVNISWTTLAERPWALTANPYNSREEVEAGLAAWADGVPARGSLRRDLLDSLKPAEDALSGFLTTRFALNEQDARKFSAYAIDYMLRSYFVFHSEVGGYSRKSLETPWPENYR